MLVFGKIHAGALHNLFPNWKTTGSHWDYGAYKYYGIITIIIGFNLNTSKTKNIFWSTPLFGPTWYFDSEPEKVDRTAKNAVKWPNFINCQFHDTKKWRQTKYFLQWWMTQDYTAHPLQDGWAKAEGEIVGVINNHYFFIFRHNDGSATTEAKKYTINTNQYRTLR